MLQNRKIFKNISQLWIKRGEVLPGPAWLEVRAGRVEDFGRGPRGEGVDLGGRAVIPGLVECHTHLVFAGNRVNEFEQRALGMSYRDIAEQGGGIMATVRATNAASDDELFDLAMQRLNRFLAQGVTTVEVKTGYGLNLAAELRLLRVIKRLQEAHPLRISATLLAHKPPADRDRGGFVDEVIHKWIPAVKGLARQFDVFCDSIAFDAEESYAMLKAAKQAGLGLRVHAEQLSHTGISGLAAGLGASSADHLDFVREQDLEAMAVAGTAAVLLPGCGVTLGTRDVPSIKSFKKHGIPVALSTDYNPGSSVTMNLPLMGSLAMGWMGFSYDDAIQAVTEVPARVLGMETGTLDRGRPADFVALDTDDFRWMFYEYAVNHVACVYRDGEVIYEASGSGHGRPQQ